MLDILGNVIVKIYFCILIAKSAGFWKYENMDLQTLKIKLELWKDFSENIFLHLKFLFMWSSLGDWGNPADSAF